MPPTGSETLRMLGGFSQFNNGDHAYFVAEGLEVGHTYRLMHDAAGTPDFDHGALDAAANANGRAVASLQLSNSGPFDFYLHYTSNTDPSDRVGSSTSVDWQSGHAVVEYGTPAVLTDCNPGNTIISLNWSASTSVDVLDSGIEYQVRRSTDGVTFASFSGSSNLTVLGLVNTGRTNGTLYYYLVRTTFFYVDDLITVTAREDTGFYDSNVLSAVPYTASEFWGSVSDNR